MFTGCVVFIILGLMTIQVECYCAQKDCDSKSYRDGSRCQLKKNYTTECFGLTGECDNSKGLFCPAFDADPSTRANCPFYGPPSFRFCDCAAGQFYDNRIGGSDNCALPLLYGDLCLADCTCTRGLLCLQSQCLCPSGKLSSTSVQSRTFGLTAYTIESTFKATIADLSSLTVYYDDLWTTGIKFTYKNGAVDTHGRTAGVNSNTVDLTNNRMIGVGLRSGGLIDALQFLLENKSTRVTSWTPRMGGDGGDYTLIDKTTVYPNAISHEIEFISGVISKFSVYHNIFAIYVGSKYTQC